MSTPRHRREPGAPSASRLQPPPIPLRSIDFDAVAPMRRRVTEATAPHTGRESSPSATSTRDSMRLAHS
ncbi:MAG: hypothetical protein ABI566_00445 [Pseudolysinimonas sp.]